MVKRIYQLTKDDVWNSFNIDTIEYFEKLANQICFDPDVSEDVIKRFEVVKKLIRYSFFEYDFIDVAIERALGTFELALRKRYLELEKNAPGEKCLGDLINWANTKNLFEFSKGRVENLRSLRNKIVGHPERNSKLGISFFDLIFSIVNIINELYDNVELRNLRKRETRKVKKELDTIIKNGAIINNYDVNEIVFLGKLVYFNNKIDPHKYIFIFYPIFDIIKNENRINYPCPFIVEGKSWTIEDDSFIIHRFDSEKIIIREIKESDDRTRFNKWNVDITTYDFPLMEVINIEINKYFSGNDNFKSKR